MFGFRKFLSDEAGGIEAQRMLDAELRMIDTPADVERAVNSDPSLARAIDRYIEARNQIDIDTRENETLQDSNVINLPRMNLIQEFENRGAVLSERIKKGGYPDPLIDFEGAIDKENSPDFDPKAPLDIKKAA